MIKFGICNELFEGWEFGRICRFVKEIGYDGLEIAPFTLAPTVTGLSLARRRELDAIVRDAGLETIGLHWLLARTEGFYLTAPDPAVRRATGDYLIALAEATRDLGGSLMVLGSPKQRDRLPGVTFEQAKGYAIEVFGRIMPAIGAAGVNLCLEPLAHSSRLAKVPGTISRRLVRCARMRVVRDAERPGGDSVPDDPRHLVELVGCYPVGAPLAHHIGAERRVRHVGADVHGVAPAREGIQVFGKALPVPAQAFGQGRAGNVFHAFHQLDQPSWSSGSDRGEADAAIADDDRGHAMDRGRRQHAVPDGLAVVVGMDVHEAGRDQSGPRRRSLDARARRSCRSRRSCRHDGHVADEGARAGAVDDPSTAHNEVEHASPRRCIRSLSCRWRYGIVCWGAGEE